MKKFFCFLIMLIVLQLSAFGDQKKKYLEYYFDDFQLNFLPGAQFFPTILETYFPDTVMLIEDSNGFALADNPRVYYEGDSQVYFNWYFNGFDISSSQNHGAAAVMLPFSLATGYGIQSETPFNNQYGMNIYKSSLKNNGLQVKFSNIIPDAGSYVSFSEFMVHNHALNRNDLLYNTRRKFKENFFLDLNYSKYLKDDLHITLASTYYNSERKFNDFNVFDQMFSENSNLLLLSANLTKLNDNKESEFEFFTILNIKDRANQDAELGRYPQETYKVNRLAGVAGVLWKGKKITSSLSLSYESEKISSEYEDFSKDLLDNDGEGFGINDYKLGTFNTVTLRGRLESNHDLFAYGDKIVYKPYVSFSWMNHTGNEEKHNHNSVFFNQDPYLVLLWDQENVSYSNSKINAQAGVSLKYDFTKGITGLANFFIKYDRVFLSNNRNNLAFANPGFDAGILFFKNSRTNLLLSYGIIPYDYRSNVNDFLETSRPSGEYYYWDDINDNNMYDDGENGSLYGLTGGNSHFLDADLTTPYKHRFLLSLNSRISDNWSFLLKGIYKKFENNFRVKFGNEYGHYEQLSEQSLYVFDKPFSEYYLSNLEYEEVPFYAQLYFAFRGKKLNRWFFNFSFMAHIGMGYTPFGNGAGTSDPGLINENMANPNSLLNCFGRVDGDRAFVGKLNFGFYLFKNIFISMSLKYRDGNPFAEIRSEEFNDQYLLYYNSIKAEDQYGNKPGPREDYLSEMNVKLNYSFQMFNKSVDLSLSVMNLLDVGGEFSEFVFIPGKRLAMEMQIPRSILLSFRLNL